MCIFTDFANLAMANGVQPYTGCQNTDNVNIGYKNQQAKDECTPGTQAYEDAVKMPQSPQALEKRLRDIDAAPTMRKFLGSKQLTGKRDRKGNFHELEDNRKGQIACALDGGERLVMEPNHNPLPLDENGKLDWEQVTAVTILGVEDYHGTRVRKS